MPVNLRLYKVTGCLSVGSTTNVGVEKRRSGQTQETLSVSSDLAICLTDMVLF